MGKWVGPQASVYIRADAAVATGHMGVVCRKNSPL